MRKIKSLISAELTREGPFLPKHLKGTKAEGVRYERTIGKIIRRAHPDWEIRSSQWILFYDSEGRGFAQPDHYILFDERVLLIECKRTQRDTHAIPQMEGLYRPLLAHIYQRPIQCVQCAKFVRGGQSEVDIADIESALFQPADGTLLWHCLGI